MDQMQGEPGSQLQLEIIKQFAWYAHWRVHLIIIIFVGLLSFSLPFVGAFNYNENCSKHCHLFSHSLFLPSVAVSVYGSFCCRPSGSSHLMATSVPLANLHGVLCSALLGQDPIGLPYNFQPIYMAETIQWSDLKRNIFKTGLLNYS